MLAQKMLLRPVPAVRCAATSRAFTVAVHAERMSLNSLGPAKGAHRGKARKGRGTAAGQGGTCGFGNRGQKCRSGSGVRTGFEGGQIPLYRRLPKLRGIAGGMGAGLPDFVTINVGRLNEVFSAGEEINLETLKAKNIIGASGRSDKLPLKVLGNGKLEASLNISARAFSASAKAKIEAAGGSAVVVPGKPKWTKKSHKRMVEAMKKAGKDYFQEKLAKKVALLQAKGRVNPKRLLPKKVKSEAVMAAIAAKKPKSKQ